MSLQDLYISSSRRAVQLRMRADLIVQSQSFQGRLYRVIKDPLTLRYYRFEEEEFTILEALDGERSLDDIREAYEHRFSPEKISLNELHRLISNLYRSGLLISNAAGQGDSLLARRTEREKNWWKTIGGSILSMRFRGINPDRLLTLLNHFTSPLFTVPAAILAAIWIASALLLVAVEFESFNARLPTFQQFFAGPNWIWLAITLCLTKVLHEFGHGLACKKFGGHCHEMGLMLLILTPCLYCNVTDSWMIRSKWKRAAIGAAGMYVELILAATCTFLWWMSEPGLLNHLCLNVMFVSSVSTLLFNANPLMRYDGYYILSDLLEIPNLRQKSITAVQQTLGRWFLGMQVPDDPFLPKRQVPLFALYGIFAPIYGWLVSISIFWMLYNVLAPAGLKILGQFAAVLMLIAMLVAPLWKGLKLIIKLTKERRVNTFRSWIVLGSLTAAVGGILLVPLPHYIVVPMELAPHNATNLYVDVAGEVQSLFVTSGPVKAGQPIVELANIDARIAEQRLLSQRHQLATRVEGLRQRAHTDDSALLEVAETEEALEAIDKQLRQRQEQIQRMIVRAPLDGILVPPPTKPRPASKPTTLASWHGRPLSVRNVGAYLEESTLIGRIVQPGALEAMLAVSQNDIEFVVAGQEVDMVLDQWPGIKLVSRVEHISRQELEVAPRSLSTSAGGTLATRADSEGRERPLEVTYLVSVPIQDDSHEMLIGGSGEARIHAGHLTIGQRIYRAFCKTFHFDM
ncbi:peptidase M50 [Pirellula staleyi DSM 6068]|uniref:Peptidase M50 n=1 Tax=Pirellula staleyi (strain ATCC 27377 / DSM 6068 / ICPB 4128) TaxID=530564 RepID=D2R2L5_PIRSD|nr:peptidase M50 [Pirellula staleyi]ADB16855.1 peptidase M50 [Pirellula staleyi DSM 6068]